MNAYYMTITTIGGQERAIKLCGTIYNPYFCGKEVCEILGYSNHQDTIFKQVKEDHKKTLKTILLEVEKFNNGPIEPYGVQCNFHFTSLGDFDLENLSYNDGKVMFLSDHGVYDLLKGSENHKIFKEQFERFIYTIKYENNSGLMNIFSFIKGSPLAIDITSNWFQDLWYPLSKANPSPGGGVGVVENQPIIVTQNLLEWMGYKGRDQADKQERFSRVLESLEIPYEEIDHRHPLAIEYPCVQKEMKLIPKQLDQKRWISMDQRAFKEVVLGLKTKNAKMVRSYYLNLEEAMMAYSHYTMNYMIEQRNYELSNTMAQLAIRDRSEEDLQNQLEEERLRAEQAKKEAEERLEEERQQAEERLEEERLRAEQAKKEAEEERQRLQDQIKANEDYTLVLQDLMIDDQKREKTQVVYIATSKNYAKQNRFKPGGVESVDKLTPRLSTYNSRSAAGDEWFYCATFLVADYHQIEARLKDLLRTFKDKKSKEIYIMHYTNIHYMVKYLCEHYNEEVDEVNAKLTEFISNLHPHHLRPIVPDPCTTQFANITSLKEDGTVTNTALQADSLKEFNIQLKKYILKIDSTTKEITRKKVFDDLKVKIGRKEKYPILKDILRRVRPDINLKSKE